MWKISKLQLFEISSQEIFLIFLMLALAHQGSLLFHNSITVILLFLLFWYDDSKKKNTLEEHFARLVEGITNQN